MTRILNEETPKFKNGFESQPELNSAIPKLSIQHTAEGIITQQTTELTEDEKVALWGPRVEPCTDEELA